MRLSILWNARPADVPSDPPPLTPDQIVEIIDTDLRLSKADVDHDDAPLTDHEWLRHVHATYYPDLSTR